MSDNKLQGKITISRPQSNRTGDYISITVRDEVSGTTVLELSMSILSFGYAITGLGAQECAFEMHTALLGKERQHKTETLNFGHYPTMAEVMEESKAYEVGGWENRQKGRQLSVSHQKGDVDYVVNVLFVRYVDKEQS